METDVKKLMGHWKSSDSKKFESLWNRCFNTQFNEKFKSSAKCYRANVGITDYILSGKGNKTKKVFEFDGLVVLTDDHKPYSPASSSNVPVIINLEYTIGRTNDSLDYWTLESKPAYGKLIKLMRFMDTDGHPAEREERLTRLQEKYPSTFPNEEDFDTAYLIGVDRFREILLSEHVSEIQNHVDGAFPGRGGKVSAVTNSGAIIVEMDGFKIIAGVLNLGQCADHMSTVLSLGKAPFLPSNNMKQLFFERALFELTQKTAGEEFVLLSGMPLESIPVTVLSNNPPNKSTNLHTASITTLLGHNVETYRLRITLKDLIRMCCVERTVNEVGALQRLPERNHMKMIGEEGIKEGREFVNPIVISTTTQFQVRRDMSTNQDYLIPPKSSSELNHYSWALIDGQHRVFSGYMVDLFTPKMSNVEFDAVIRYLDSGRIIEEERNDINADTFFDLNYRQLHPKPDIALVRSTEISAWPGGWIVYKPKLAIYSSRVIAARFLLELNKKGPLETRFGLGGTKFGKDQVTLSSYSTYLGDTYNHFDLYFRYIKKGTPDNHKLSVGRLYADWGVTSSKGTLVYPDNSEWQANYPPRDSTNPSGLEDGKKVGLTCRDLDEREFWPNIADDFNQFLNEIVKNFNPSKHKFNVGGIDVDWTDSQSCLYITKNSGILPGLFGAWFAYVKKHRPPSRPGAGHAISKNYNPKIGKAIAGFFESKIHNENPKIPGVSPDGGLFKNSDGKDCEHHYSSANGMKLFRTDLIAVINDVMGWSSSSDKIEF